MVKFRGFQGLTFRPQLYGKYLKKDLQHIEKNEIVQELDIQELIEQGVLRKQNQQCLYLYQQQFKDHISLGLLGELSVKDYKHENIKKHQETLDTHDKNLNQDTIAQGHIAPVVVGYQNNEQIDKIIQTIQLTKKPYAQWKTIDNRKHRLWKITDCKQLTSIFNSEIQNFYILDGHHRFQAAAEHLKKEGQNANQKDKWIIGLAYQARYIKVYPQYRQIVDENSLHIVQSILKYPQISIHEEKQIKLNQLKASQILLVSQGKIYKLNQAKQGQSNSQKCAAQILNAILQSIKLPKDKIQQGERDNQNQNKLTVQQKIKLQYIPAILIDISHQQDILQRKNPIFFMNSPSIHQIFQYGDKCQVLPPKSTWLEPKPCLHMVARFYE